MEVMRNLSKRLAVACCLKLESGAMLGSTCSRKAALERYGAMGKLGDLAVRLVFAMSAIVFLQVLFDQF